jgi:hypothetical protein
MKSRIILALLPVVIISCASLALSRNDIDKAKKTLSPQVLYLENIRIVKQPSQNSCGISTFTNVCNYLKAEDGTIDHYIEKYSWSLEVGVGPETLVRLLEKELPDYTANFYSEISNVRVLSLIHASLNQGIPVIVLFGSPNIFDPPYYDFHFSTIYGLDLPNETITISNAYGFIETITLMEFQKRMIFSDKSLYPSKHLEYIREHLVAPNELIVITPKK